MPTYFTPGVYFESSDANRRQVNAIRTDIAAFVGAAERGPLHRPTPVRSWAQFASTFGGFLDGCYLAFAVKAFFENGGRLCYVVRAASESAKAAQVILRDGNGLPALMVCASSPGSWGNQISVQVRYTSRAATCTRQSSPDNQSSLVKSVVGFQEGGLVRIYQDQQNGRPASVYRYVRVVDPLKKRLEWDQPLDAPFDLNQSMSLETREFALDVFYRGPLDQSFLNLSLFSGTAEPANLTGGLPECGGCPGEDRPEQHVERVVNTSPSARIQVCALPSDSTYEQRLPARTGRPVVLTGGADGLSDLSLTDLTGAPGQETLRGLRALEPVDEVAIVAIPDLLMHALPAPPPPAPEEEKCPPLKPRPVKRGQPVEPLAHLRPLLFSPDLIFDGQSRLVEHCELLKDRIALLDPPFLPEQDGFTDFGEIQSWRQGFDSSYAALYFPWLLVYDPLRPGQQLVQAVPPCGHVAGAYARSDLEIGVHKAPANSPLHWVQDVAVEVTPDMQGALNPIGVNCIRTFPGRGIRIYGARTVSSNTLWRYVNVRRLMMMIEEALEESCQYAVFEPNDFTLRQSLSMSISNFLTVLWQQGALQGASANEAFEVQCDEENNPPELAENGQFVVDVHVAPVKPAEFVVIRIGRTEQELEISEVLGT